MNGMPPPGFFPPSGYGYPPPLPPGGGGVPPYPGPAGIYQDPRFQYGPSFDGLYSRGLTTNQYLNSQFEDINMMQHQIYSAAGVGYPQNPPYPPLPGMAPMPMPPGPPPGTLPPPYYKEKGGKAYGEKGGTEGYSAKDGNGQKMDTYA